MNKMLLIGLCGLICFGLLIIIGGEVSDNEISESIINSLPDGYTLDSYVIEEITKSRCTIDTDCITPMEYNIQSRCPFTSICLENECVVVCPDFKN